MPDQESLFDREWARPVQLAGSEVRIGTCSWSDPEFVRTGGFYPRGTRSRPEARLQYYATVFPTVEVDATYYALVAPAQARRWIDWTPPGFDFHVKAFRLFTGHGLEPGTLPRYIREFLPRSARDAQRVDTEAVPDEVVSLCWEHFLSFLEVFRNGNRLGYVLFQFPRWHTYSPRRLDRIAALRQVLGADRIAVEFRHRSWVEGEARHRVVAALRAHHMIYVIPDEPALAWTVPPHAEITADWSVVRFHGRNAGAWSTVGVGIREVYRYDYTPAELHAWADTARAVAPQAARLYLMFNNHTDGNAARNASTMRSLLRR